MTGHTIFISHKTENKKVAREVCEQLEGRGINCWVAYRDEEPGREYASQILDAIAQARVMIFILSSHSNKSPHYVKRELQCAVGEHLHVVVFRIENVQPSRSFRFYIETEHWLDAFPKPSKEDYKKLVVTVKRRLYEGDFNSVKNLWSKKRWLSCLKQCATIFEKAMRELLKDLLDWLKDKNVRKRIMTTQRKIGGGKSTFTSFGLPRLVQLYMEADIFDQLRIQLTSSLPNIHTVDWSQVVECYRASRRQDCTRRVAKPATEKMIEFLKILLYDCELAGDIGVIKPQKDLFLEECASCTWPLEEGWGFCPHCGISTRTACEQCHRPLQPNWTICPYCEKRVSRHSSVRPDDLQRGCDEFRTLCKGVYTDEVVNARERRRLEEKRLELGLSAEEAEEIERACAPRNIWKYMQLVRHKLIDGVIDKDERIILDTKAKEWNIDRWVKKQIEEAETTIRHGALDDLGSEVREMTKTEPKMKHSMKMKINKAAKNKKRRAKTKKATKKKRGTKVRKTHHYNSSAAI